MERLNKYLAHAGIGSRRHCDTLISDGRVKVNGVTVADLGAKIDPATHKVSVDDQLVKEEKPVYWIVNKPPGYLCTNSDPEGRPRASELLPHVEQRVYTVGRLDEASEGLLLMTNDGELAFHLMHPRYGVPKTYLALVAGKPTPQDIQKLLDGVWLSDGKVKAQAVRRLKPQGNSTWLRIVLTEGKNREIRRMLSQLGHKVMKLRRVAIGPIDLDKLPKGKARRVTEGELQELRKLVGVAQEKIAKARVRAAESDPLLGQLRVQFTVHAGLGNLFGERRGVSPPWTRQAHGGLTPRRSPPITSVPIPMFHRTVLVIEHVALAERTFRIRLHCPEIAATIRPGQFVMLRLPRTSDPLLGRPFALYDTVLDDTGAAIGFDVVYLVIGKMTGLLAHVLVGNPLEVWGPLGQPFPEFDAIERIALVAGGIGQTPFLAYARDLLGTRGYGGVAPRARTRQVTLYYGVRTAELAAGVEDFRQVGVDVQLASDDGSIGYHGYVTQLVEQQGKQGPLVGCGPEPMLRSLAALAAKWEVPCRVSLETPMACGIGICFSCVTKLKTCDGGWDYKRVCVEGPVFDAAELAWE